MYLIFAWKTRDISSFYLNTTNDFRLKFLNNDQKTNQSHKYSHSSPIIFYFFILARYLIKQINTVGQFRS